MLIIKLTGLTRHAIINIIFASALLALIYLNRYHQASVGWIALLAFIYSIVIALGSYFIQLNFFFHSYCNGSRSKPQIAITFDDGPQGAATAGILDILKTEKASATFFLIGKNISGQEALVQRISAEGHTIGTHSFHHHWSFQLQAPRKIAEEIVQTQKLVADIVRLKPMLFRPPFGVTDPPLASAVRQTGVKSIGWSVRSYDTVIADPDKLMKRICKLKNGDIVLFHDTGLQTNVILSSFIKYVRSQGLEIVPLPELSGIKAYED